MKYFNENQIQRIVDAFPPELKEKFSNIELKGKTSWKPSTVPEKIVHDAFENDCMRAYRCMNRKFYVDFSLESDKYNQPSGNAFEPILREIEKELFELFGYEVEADIDVISMGKEPDDIFPLYWGELENTAKYQMSIRINIL